MVSFIVCDDDKFTLKKVEKIIDRYMMKNKLAYDLHLFEDYDQSFMEMMNNGMTNKIYILDIQTPTKSGIDIARHIRIKDINSVIIFLTNHEELGLTILKNELMFLSFINKYDDYENRLNKSIKKALELLSIKKAIRFEDRGIIYTILVDDILYVTRDGVERKSIIKTLNSEIKINKTLIELHELLGEKFIKTHKACLVNSDRVISVNKQERTIKFDNGLEIDLLSLKYKKDLINIIK